MTTNDGRMMTVMINYHCIIICITSAADDRQDDNTDEDCDDKGDDCDDKDHRSVLCITNAASEEMMIWMMTVTIMMLTVMLTFIVASSALPMLPNATIKIYEGIRNKKETING